MRLQQWFWAGWTFAAPGELIKCQFPYSLWSEIRKSSFLNTHLPGWGSWEQLYLSFTPFTQVGPGKGSHFQLDLLLLGLTPCFGEDIVETIPSWSHSYCPPNSLTFGACSKPQGSSRIKEHNKWRGWVHTQSVAHSCGSQASSGPLGPAEFPKLLSVLGTQLWLAVLTHCACPHCSLSSLTWCPSFFIWITLSKGQPSYCLTEVFSNAG